MDLRRLEIFLAVVEVGTFTGAADELEISQPAVSQAVATLERELGAALFHRLGRAVRLTDAGVALCAPARLALRDVAAAKEAVAAVHDLLGGHLELACLPTLAVAPLAPIVGTFRREFPAVTISLLDPDDTSDVLSLVQSGRCELGILGDVLDTDLELVAMAPQAYRVLLPPGSSGASTIGVAELASMPIVAPPRGSSSRDLLDEVLAREGRRALVVVEPAQREALVPLVLAGAGVALVPVSLAAIGEQLGCEVAALRPDVGRGVSIVHRRAPLTPAARAFLEIAVAHAAD
jgi:LysR family transcriptional regulator, carnitine catabolism transcriptional activator